MSSSIQTLSSRHQPATKCSSHISMSHNVLVKSPRLPLCLQDIDPSPNVLAASSTLVHHQLISYVFKVLVYHQCVRQVFKTPTYHQMYQYVFNTSISPIDQLRLQSAGISPMCQISLQNTDLSPNVLATSSRHLTTYLHMFSSLITRHEMVSLRPPYTRAVLPIS